MWTIPDYLSIHRAERNLLRIAQLLGLAALSVRLLALVLACLSAQSVLGQVSSATSTHQSLQEQGRELFEREWQSGALPDGRGDGLGPLFNEKSCVACHFQGGIGGGGPLKNNVEMLSARSADGDTRVTRTFAAQLAKIHPGFLGNGQLRTTLVLHKQGVSPAYNDGRTQFLGQEFTSYGLTPEAQQREFSQQPIVSKTSPHGPHLFISQRNSSAMFGAGLIDAIPDALLQEIAAQQPIASPGISGRATLTTTGVGRFGWRGRTARLAEFVANACANELGVSSPGNEQIPDPLSKRKNPSTPDMLPQELNALTAFVASLPAPRRQKAPVKLISSVKNGRHLFNQVGCAACHIPSLGPAEDIYSDLLLHDMGLAVADPAAAVPNTLELIRTFVFNMEDVEYDKPVSATTVTRPGLFGRPIPPPSPSDYYGAGNAAASILSNLPFTAPPGSSSVGRFSVSDQVMLEPQSTAECEYRTPPLWGMKDSAPYMHDGRAASVIEAIAYHGGEGSLSRDEFFALGPDEQSNLLAFLDTLAVK